MGKPCWHCAAGLLEAHDTNRHDAPFEPVLAYVVAARHQKGDFFCGTGIGAIQSDGLYPLLNNLLNLDTGTEDENPASVGHHRCGMSES